MRTYDASTTRQGEAKPFHQHTFRFPHYRWFVLATMFYMVRANPGVYPRKDPKDGTVTELITVGHEIRSVKFTNGRYIRMITRI